MNVRQSQILKLIEVEGDATVAALASRFDVTEMTIRRDLDALEKTGRIVRTHGGAVLSRSGIIEFAFLERGRAYRERKCAIARAVAQRIEPGMTVTLDTGTTCLEVARAIAGVENLKVLTLSLAAASELYAHRNIELVLLGGNVRSPNPDLSGPLAESNLRRFHVDLTILGVDAANPEGLFTTDLGLAQMSRAMIDGADRALLAVDSSKFGRSSFVLIDDWARIDEVVTDDAAPKDERQWLEEIRARIEYVPVPAGAGASETAR